MTRQVLALTPIPRDAANITLVDDILSAAKRAQKADPGDRVDAHRYETLCVQLERIADAEGQRTGEVERYEWFNELSGPGLGFQMEGLSNPFGSPLLERLSGSARAVAQAWIDAGHIVVANCDALSQGSQPPTSTSEEPPPPAETWESKTGATGKRAVIERFRSQLEESLGNNGTAQPFNPSDIHNQVITEVLREHIVGSPTTMVTLPVAYNDGSQAANPFPLKCLNLVGHFDGQPDVELSLALLSIRHTEMDPMIDGAWLRNAEVSKPRQAALTDDFVYATSMTQLKHLTDDGQRKVLLRMFQTGLDTAIIGFYRAVVDQILAHPSSLAVIPMFYSSGAPSSVHQENADFVEGLPWATNWS